MAEIGYKIKAGKFTFEKQTNKVKVCRDQGLIHISRNEEYQTHFRWINNTSHMEQLDIIVFPGDAIFEKVHDKKNTFVLRFGMDDERYFYWLQEKADEEKVVSEINRIINMEIQDEDNQMIDEKDEKPKADQQSKPLPVPKAQQAKIPFNLSDMIKNLGKQLGVKNKKQGQDLAITHLCDIATPDFTKKVLESFTEEDKAELLEFMPEQQRDTKHFESNIRSPQFMQALDVLSDALNSQNAFPLFAEMRLKDSYLNNYYGVQAFLRALIEKAKSEKQQKKQQ